MLSTLLTNAKSFTVQNSSSVLLGIAIAGVVSTGFAVAKASIKADKILEEMEYTAETTPTTKEKFKAVAPIFIPSIVIGSATITCMCVSHSIDLRRQAALASLYSISEKAIKEYESKVKEVVGEKKAGQIKDEIHKDHITNNPPVEDDIIRTGNGDTLCYDEWSGQYFYSDAETIRSAVNTLNEAMNNSDDFISLNALYYELGIRQTKLGDEIGWHRHYEGLIDLMFSSQLSQNNKPCLVMDFYNSPGFKFRCDADS